MPDARTVEGLRRVAGRLRARRVEVVEVPGWHRRGAGKMRPRGHVEHHTASSRTGSFGPLLKMLTYGRASLRNALCTWAVPRDGHAAYLVAAGTAWHAGRGGWRGLTGNSSVSGTEVQNDGIGEPWQPAALAVEAAIAAEMAREFGFPATSVCEHAEWAPARKVDRRGPGVEPGWPWRRRITRMLTAPPPAPPADEEDTDMPTDVVIVDGETWLIDHPWRVPVPAGAGAYYQGLARSGSNPQYEGPYEWDRERLERHPMHPAYRAVIPETTLEMDPADVAKIAEAVAAEIAKRLQRDAP